MDGWIRLDQDQVAATREVAPGSHDMRFDVAVGPYDLPTAARARRQHGKIFIDFQYADGEEPVIPTRLDGHVRVFEGRFSRRLHSIEIDPTSGCKTVGVSFTVESIGHEIDHAWDRVVKTAGPVKTNEQRTGVRELFESRKGQLLSDLVASQ